MIVLRDDQLQEFAALLEKDFPASLNVHGMVKNHLDKQRAWPGVTFIVDSFPDFSACVCRTSTDDKEHPPFINGYSIFVHARDPAKLKALLSLPDVVDWTKRVGVFNVQRPDCYRVVGDKCRSLGGHVVCSMESDLFVERAFFVGFKIKDIQYTYTLPQGLRLGKLKEHHAQQLTTEKHYGDLDKNCLFFQHLLRSGFPSAAIFNEKDEVVAYVLQRPEGVMGAGFVNPDYRQKGLFKIVLYELLKEMEGQGATLGFADITVGNEPSLRAMLSIGGFVYPNYEACWFEYLPSK